MEFHYDLHNLGLFGVILYWINFVLFPIKLLVGIGGGLAFLCLAFAIWIIWRTTSKCRNFEFPAWRRRFVRTADDRSSTAG